MASSKQCSLCDKDAIRKGLCPKHSSAAWRAAHPGYSAKKRAEWVERNLEYVKEQRRNTYWEKRDELLARGAKWRAENHKKYLLLASIYRANNREKCAETVRAWRKKYPERARALGAAKKARLREAPGRHTEQQIKRLYSAQKGRCAICRIGLSTKYHLDHIQPLSRGGSNDIGNIQLLCPPCNQHKSDRDPIEHMQSLGRLL